MFLQFLDLYGNPVYVRPDRVDALRGLAVTHDGQLRAGTLVVMTNRETFRLRGHVDTISTAISEWHTAQAAKADAFGLRLPDDWEDRVADQPVGLTDRLYGAGDNTTGLVSDPNSASGFRVA